MNYWTQFFQSLKTILMTREMAGGKELLRFSQKTWFSSHPNIRAYNPYSSSSRLVRATRPCLETNFAETNLILHGSFFSCLFSLCYCLVWCTISVWLLTLYAGLSPPSPMTRGMHCLAWPGLDWTTLSMHHLCYAVLYTHHPCCTVLYTHYLCYAVLYTHHPCCTVLYYISLHMLNLYCAVVYMQCPYCTMHEYCTVLYCTVLHYTRIPSPNCTPSLHLLLVEDQEGAYSRVLFFQ